ncbi:MAG: hypothetical protein KGJ02_05760 [Verrucomicrobiota bacterium]|nr:hypothetical protein [Verrucomicrobiota bacterium]
MIRLPGESLLFPELVNRIFTLLPADDAPLREKFIPILQEFGKILEEMENVVPKDSHSYRAILSWKTKELLLKKDAWKVIK